MPLPPLPGAFWSDTALSESGERAQTAGSSARNDPLRVLSLSANPTANFYESQVSALERHGIECTTVSPPPYRGLDRSPYQYLRVWIETLQAAPSEYDIVHANYGLMGPLALAQPTRPVVMTLWGTDVMGGGWVSAMSKRTAKHCDAVIAPSKRLARQLHCDSYVVQFDVDTELFRPIPRDAARERLGWDPEETVVLFPYDRREVKNYPMAERVVTRLSGDVTLRRVWGVDYEEMPLYYNASDALVVTSKREAGPMTVKEAMACNVPIVSRDVGFVGELLAGVRNSHVVDDESTFVRRLESVLASDRRADGRAVVRRRNDMGAELRAVYESVL